MLEVQDTNMTDFYTVDVDMAAEREEWSRVADAEMSDRDDEDQAEEVNMMEPVETISPYIIDEEFTNGDVPTLRDEEVFDVSTLHSPMPGYPSLSTTPLESNHISNIAHVLKDEEVVWDASHDDASHDAPHPDESAQPLQETFLEQNAVPKADKSLLDAAGPSETHAASAPTDDRRAKEAEGTEVAHSVNVPEETVESLEEVEEKAENEETDEARQVLVPSGTTDLQKHPEEASNDEIGDPETHDDDDNPESSEDHPQPAEEQTDGDVDPPPSIRVSFPSADVLFYLFRPPHEHHQGSQEPNADIESEAPVLFQNRPSLCRGPLSELFQALRTEDGFADYIGEAELVIAFVDLSLEIGEDNRFTTEVTAADLDILHASKQIDGPLKMELRLNVDRFATRYRKMMDQIHRDIEASDHEDSDGSLAKTEEAEEAGVDEKQYVEDEESNVPVETADPVSPSPQENPESSEQGRVHEDEDPSLSIRFEEANKESAGDGASLESSAFTAADTTENVNEDGQSEGEENLEDQLSSTKVNLVKSSEISSHLEPSVPPLNTEISSGTAISHEEPTLTEFERDEYDDQEEDAEGIDEQEYYEDAIHEEALVLRSKRSYDDLQDDDDRLDVEEVPAPNDSPENKRQRMD